MYWSFNSYQEKHLLQDSWLWEADTFQRSHTCLGKWSNGNCGKIQSTTREKRKEPGVTSLPHVLHSWEYINTAQVLRVCWKTDIISTFTREQANIHLKAPGGQSPAQTHAAALLCAHAKTHTHTATRNTLLHNRLWCHQHWYVHFPQTLTLSQGFILYTEISELIASSSWAYPHTYTEITVLDALMLAAHEYASDSDLQHIQRITSDTHSRSRAP